MIAISSFAPIWQAWFLQKETYAFHFQTENMAERPGCFQLLHFAWTHKNINHKLEITNMSKTSNKPSSRMTAHWNVCSIKINI